MPKLTFLHKDGKKIELDAPEGLSVMEVAVQNDIEEIEGACGGSLACATCHVYVHPDWWDKTLPEDGDVSEDEEDMLDLAFDLRKCSRLGCQIIMDEEKDGLTVALPGTKVDW
ncbi:MAG: 2Fe-2S ferredoxin [Alphaproteobacteria bacterium]|nr:2Fe-2S ferredoxin [Alphaproteobacteria bacterium]